MIIDEKFLLNSCECKECEQIFAKVKRHVDCVKNLNEEEKNLANNLEGNVNEEEGDEVRTVPNAMSDDYI